MIDAHVGSATRAKFDSRTLARRTRKTIVKTRSGPQSNWIALATFVLLFRSTDTSPADDGELSQRVGQPAKQQKPEDPDSREFSIPKKRAEC